MKCHVRLTHDKYLADHKIAAEYLNLAIKEGNLSVILMAVRNIVKAMIKAGFRIIANAISGMTR